jgi:hypothetical protein
MQLIAKVFPDYGNRVLQILTLRSRMQRTFPIEPSANSLNRSKSFTTRAGRWTFGMTFATVRHAGEERCTLHPSPSQAS